MQYVIKEYYSHSGEFIGDTWRLSSMEAVSLAREAAQNSNVKSEVWKVFYDTEGELKEILKYSSE